MLLMDVSAPVVVARSRLRYVGCRARDPAGDLRTVEPARSEIACARASLE